MWDLDIQVDHPVNNIKWLKASKLRPNKYNPNTVHYAEMQLLRVSLLEDLWCEPIKVFKIQKGVFEIIDGYHRWKLVTEDEEIANLTNPSGLVPVTILEKSKAERMCATVRFNRASGVHGVLPMAKIVNSLIKKGLTITDVMDKLGMEMEEVLRLTNSLGMPFQVAKTEFSQAWKPKY